MPPCAIAIERYKNIARWRNLWTILLFIFGATQIGFAVFAVFYLIYQNYFPGVLTAAVSVVNFVGITWVLARRNEAVNEEKEAYNEAMKVCGGGGTGKTAATAERSPPEKPAYQQEMDVFAAKLNLIGKIR